MPKLRFNPPRPATVIAVAVLSLTGAGAATAATLITGKEAKNNSITGADIKRGSLSANDLSQSARNALGSPGGQGPAGATGATGPAGTTGPTGPAGTAEPAGLATVMTAEATNVAVGKAEKLVVELPLEFTVPGDGPTDRMQVLLQGEVDNSSDPARVRITCSADDQLTVREARIRAIQVGQIG